MAAKKPLQDPAVPDGAVEGINPADMNAYKGFNFDMGTMNHNITCNSCHAGGGAAQFGREEKSLDDVLKEKLGEELFNELANNKEWFIHDEELLAKTGIDGDLLGYSDYEVGAGYIGKPGVFNYKRAGVNDTDCFMCHADAGQKDKIIHTKLGDADIYPIMPANPRVMVFKGMTEDGETIVVSLGVPPKVGEVVGGKEVAQVDSAYYYSVPIDVLKQLYNIDDDTIEEFKKGEEAKPFILYPNNANGATREVARVVYFEHTNPDKDGGEPYVGGGAALLKDGDKAVYRTFAGFFFKYISTASLMGVDTNQDGVPLAYVRFVKNEDGIWEPQVFYQKEEFDDDGKVALPILVNRDKDTYTYTVPDLAKLGTDPNEPPMIEGTKDKEWGLVCSYCHMAIPYESGTFKGQTTYTWVTRKGTLGVAAEIVKRGDVFSYHFKEDDGKTVEEIQNDPTLLRTAKTVKSSTGLPIGYDVHFSEGLSCLSCHGEGTLSDEDKEYHPIHHDFLKGNDWGGHWDQSLDYNPSLKTCIDCHFNGSATLAAKVHSDVFGPEGNAAVHIAKVSCEVCHIPFKTHWTFRAFYDVLGYSYNFDNRIMGYIKGQKDATVELSKDRYSIGFAPFMPIAGYGAPQPFPITVTQNGEDVVVPIYQVDFDPRQAALRKGNTDFGIWMIPDNAFPWGWAPAIIWNGYRPDVPGGQKFMYRIANPLTLVTWYDKTTGKVLYTREMNAALTGEIVSEAASKGAFKDKKVPAYYWTGEKVCVKTIEDKEICDDNGDFMPEINTDEEYEAMKSAIKKVLEAEGVKEPEPVFYIWTAPFSIDHGVLPAEYALGAGKTVNGETLNCSSCHDALNGRLPQANSSEINEEYASYIVKDDRGIAFFNLGRKIVTVPVEIPKKALEESVRVFFNTPMNDDGTPKTETVEVSYVVYDAEKGEFVEEKTTKNVMYTTAGDLLVDARFNGVDIDRHLVPIPVESSGVAGIAFAMPDEEKEWTMSFDGVEAKVVTKSLEGEDEVPRRAIVIRFKNEIPELLGFEHHAEEIEHAAGPDYITVVSPMIFSEYIKEVRFSLASLKVADVDALKISYAKLHKERYSEKDEETGEYKVGYELKEFEPHSVTVEEAISEGWAHYNSSSKELTIYVDVMYEKLPGEGEVVFAISRAIPAELGIPSSIEVTSEDATEAEVKLKIDNEEKTVKVEVEDGDDNLAVDVIGDVPSEVSELIEFADEFDLTKVLFGVKVIYSDAEKLTFTFKDAADVVDPKKAVLIVTKGDVALEKELELKNLDNEPVANDLVAEVSLSEFEEAVKSITRAEDGEEVVAVLGEKEPVPTADSNSVSGGGGGGCSMGATQSTASGLANLGALLTGLLGLFGLRRRKH